LLIAANEGDFSHIVASRRRLTERAERVSDNWPRFTLYPKGLERARLKGGTRSRKHVVGNEDLAGAGLGHESCGEVYRIAHDRVGLAIWRSDVAGEHPPSMHPRPHAYAVRAIDDQPHRPQHPFLVVVRRRRRTGRQDDLPAVPVDV